MAIERFEERSVAQLRKIREHVALTINRGCSLQVCQN